MDDLGNWVPIDTYNAVRIDEYSGKLSIQQGSRGDNDTYVKWCCPQKWENGKKTLLKKDGVEVFVPWAISLGKDKEKAIRIVEAIVAQLKKL